jgi:hypothetical protein
MTDRPTSSSKRLIFTNSMRVAVHACCFTFALLAITTLLGWIETRRCFDFTLRPVIYGPQSVRSEYTTFYSTHGDGIARWRRRYTWFAEITMGDWAANIPQPAPFPGAGLLSSASLPHQVKLLLNLPDPPLAVATYRGLGLGFPMTFLHAGHVHAERVGQFSQSRSIGIRLSQSTPTGYEFFPISIQWLPLFINVALLLPVGWICALYLSRRKARRLTLPTNDGHSQRRL